MNSDTGKYLMLIGGAVVIIGLIIYFFYSYKNSRLSPENVAKRKAAEQS